MVLLLEQVIRTMRLTMIPDLRFRIDMRLTDDHILNVITELASIHQGRVTLEQIAHRANCGMTTVKRSRQRLYESGRLTMEGGRGRQPVLYKVVKI